MTTTRQLRTIFRAQRSRLLGMETTVIRPTRRTSVFTTGR